MATVYIEGGEQVYPCRCGETHRGPQAWADHAHHNCFHDSPLISLAPDDPDQWLCPECGKSFRLANQKDSQ